MTPGPASSPLLGLALGGGGALGAAHVGVLEVLEERDIRPQIVVGTSIGSLIGAAYAAGMPLAEIKAHALEATWSDFGALTLTPGLGILDTAGLKDSITRLAGTELLIEDLPLRYAAVAADLSTRSPVIIDSGPVADAVAASCSVPGLFRPTRLGRHLYVDGGVLQNLPIESAFALGADYVIGVRIAPEWDALPIMRTAARIHEFEIRNDVTVIRPRLGTRSQWIARDLPELVQLGRDAAHSDLPATLPSP